MRRWALISAAVLFIGAGSLHFVATGTYLKIMPPSVPWPLAMVWVSGAMEIAGGVGMLVPRVRRLAAWGLVALLLAVFPANVFMAMNPRAFGIPEWILWARLPLQGMLIWWVLWSSAGTQQGSVEVG